MNTVEKLKELKQLLDEGILSQEEFNVEKNKLIGSSSTEVKLAPISDDLKESMKNSTKDSVRENIQKNETFGKQSYDSDVLADTKTNGLKEKLNELQAMFDDGLISENEYTNMRSEAVNGKSTTSEYIPKHNKVSINNANNSVNLKMILMIIGGLLLVILMFVGIGFGTQTTQEKLSANVSKAVQDSDSKALLKSFSKDNQKAVWALPGASMLIYNWRDETPSQIVSELVSGDEVNSYDDYSDVKVTVQSKSHMIFWKTYYLETKNTGITVKSGEKNKVTLKANVDDDELAHLDTNAKKEAEKKVSVKDMSKNGVFPGWWSFKIESPSGSTVSSDAFVKSYGRGDSNISMDFE